MDNEEKKYFRDIKMALRKLSEIGVPVTPIIKAVMNAESELRESEDERIRKALLDFYGKQCDMSDVNGVYAYEVYAWLEKQKEQKSTNIEREYIEERLRGLIDKEGEYYRGAREELAHLFYILGGQPSQYLINNVTKKEQKPISFNTPYNPDDYEVVMEGDAISLKRKEQKPAEIDEEHKVGKWFTGLIPCWIDAPSTLQPAHSYHGKNVIAIHEKSGGYRCCCVDDEKPATFSVAEDTHLVEGWKDRKPAEWSEEDNDKLFNITVAAKFGMMCKPEEIQWLQALPERFNLQPRQEWSEEDERKIVELKTFIAQCNGFNKKNRKKAFDMIDALPSQSHWKPSEEQMDALHKTVCGDDHLLYRDTLIGLYQQLKQL